MDWRTDRQTDVWIYRVALLLNKESSSKLKSNSIENVDSELFKSEEENILVAKLRNDFKGPPIVVCSKRLV